LKRKRVDQKRQWLQLATQKNADASGQHERRNQWQTDTNCPVNAIVERIKLALRDLRKIFATNQVAAEHKKDDDRFSAEPRQEIKRSGQRRFILCGECAVRTKGCRSDVPQRYRGSSKKSQQIET
jgi:hypothetical protein